MMSLRRNAMRCTIRRSCGCIRSRRGRIGRAKGSFISDRFYGFASPISPVTLWRPCVSKTTLEYRSIVPDSSGGREHDPSEVALGLICGIAAYASWGIFPVYFKLVGDVPAIVVLAHRIAWS